MNDTVHANPIRRLLRPIIRFATTNEIATDTRRARANGEWDEVFLNYALLLLAVATFGMLGGLVAFGVVAAVIHAPFWVLGIVVGLLGLWGLLMLISKP